MIKKNWKEGGTIISDNMSFHGFVETEERIKSRNLRGLVNRIKRYIKNHKFVTGIGIGVVAVALILLVANLILKKPVQNEICDINTLSISNRTVLYLNNNGAAKGSGDNTHSQISNLPTENVTKVLANDYYSVFLLNDGTLFVSGDIEDKYKNELLKKMEMNMIIII